MPLFGLGLLLPWMRFWDPSVHQAQWDGVVSLAWLGVLLGAFAACVPDDLRVRPPRLDRGSWLTVFVAGAVCAVVMAQLRVSAGLVANELFLFPPRTMTAAQIYLWDMGLPSLFHNVLIAPARLWGGVAYVTSLHVALHALVMVGLLVVLRRRVSALAAITATLLVSTLDVWLFQFTELRAYASYLALVVLASLGLVPGRHPVRLGLPVLALGLAALDAPSMAVPLVAYALGVVWEEGGVDVWGVLMGALRSGDQGTRVVRGALLAVLGLVPLSIASRDLHHIERTRIVFLSNPVIAGEVAVVLIACVWLGLRRPDARRLAVTTFAALATPVALVLARVLRDDPKYELLALPLAVVVVLWAVDEALSTRSAQARSLGAVAVALLVAAVHRPFTPSLGYGWNPDLERHAQEGLVAALTVAAVLTAMLWWRRGRVASLLVPLLVVLAGSAAWWQGVRAYAYVDDLTRSATECDADLAGGPQTWSQVSWGSADRTLRCQARAIHQARTSWSQPLWRTVDTSGIRRPSD